MGPFRQESQSEHTHKLTLRTAYIATCVTHAYETRHPSPINYTHVPRMAPQVNGEAPSSAFLSHLISYPVISDSISTFESNPYGAKSVSLGDSALSPTDPKFPVVKKPTGELIDNGKAIVFFPLKKGTEGKEYVVGVFPC